MGRKRAVTLIAFALAVLATAACDDTTNGIDDSAATARNDSETDEIETEPQSITVIAKDFDFDQDAITLKPGVIEVTLVNDGDVQHSFTSYELDSDLDLVVSPGDEGSITFTLPAGETFPFYCKFHPDEMRGGIYVDKSSDE